MARCVFFSFDYRHVWKVNQVRSLPNIIGNAAAGFQDASLWEESKKKGDKEIKKMIDAVVTNGTAQRKFINYEIDKSLERGNGIVAVQIHHLKNQNGEVGSPGAIPSQIAANGFKAYKYTTKESLAKWIEEAAKLAGK
jgi:hypothetical protein